MLLCFLYLEDNCITNDITAKNMFPSWFADECNFLSQYNNSTCHTIIKVWQNDSTHFKGNSYTWDWMKFPENRLLIAVQHPHGWKTKTINSRSTSPWLENLIKPASMVLFPLEVKRQRETDPLSISAIRQIYLYLSPQIMG